MFISHLISCPIIRKTVCFLVHERVQLPLLLLLLLILLFSKDTQFMLILLLFNLSATREL